MHTLEMMKPPPVGPVRFDDELGEWIVSRHADVTAALLDLRLWPRNGEREGRDDSGRLRLRPDMLEALAAAKVAEWRPRIEEITAAAVGALPAGRPVNLLREFVQPWGLLVAMLVTSAEPSERERLAVLGDQVFAATGEPEGSPLRPPAAAATKELERFFEAGPMPMGEPTFIALSQTTPRLLTNAWLGLFQHPGEYACLRARPELIMGAMEELLRYGGIVRRVFRTATEDLELGGMAIAKGQRVALMLASANRDPEVFPDPDIFDVTRQLSGQVALGMGRNSCVGALLIRVAGSIVTSQLLRRFDGVEVNGVGEWRVGSGFCFPASVYVTFRIHNDLA